MKNLLGIAAVIFVTSPVNASIKHPDPLPAPLTTTQQESKSEPIVVATIDWDANCDDYTYASMSSHCFN